MTQYSIAHFLHLKCTFYTVPLISVGAAEWLVQSNKANYSIEIVHSNICIITSAVDLQ